MRLTSSIERRLLNEGHELVFLPQNAILENRPNNHRTILERLRGQYLFEVVPGCKGKLESPSIYQKVEPIRPISLLKIGLRLWWDTITEDTIFDYPLQHMYTYYVRR